MIRKQSEDIALMSEWFDRVGYDVDIAALQTNFPRGPLAQLCRLGPQNSTGAFSSRRHLAPEAREEISGC